MLVISLNTNLFLDTIMSKTFNLLAVLEMQDFTKPFKLKNEVKQLELNIPNQPKAGFIASRMNKDNFWNLMYWLGMFIGFGSASFIAQPISGIICWIAIIGMPYLVKRNTDVTFDKMEQGAPMFIVNGNKRINATGIGFVALLVVSLPITAVLTGAKSKLAILFVFWFIPTLYCILRNIPIAVYFKKEAWVGDGTVSSCNNDDRIRTSIGYSWHPRNIFYKPR